MIIDFHTHCFPVTLAPRAMEQLAKTAEICKMLPQTDGTADGLLSSMKKHGIDRSVVCNIATNAHQMCKVNNFAIDLKKTYPTLIPLGSLHPDGEDLEGELMRLYYNGIKGIKIHPDYIKTNLDDKRYDIIYSLCENSDMFVISHTGFDPISPDHFYATPDMMLNVIKKHPKLKFVAAHLGGIGNECDVLKKLVGKNIYFDTSLIARRSGSQKQIETIFNLHDPDKIIFATDTPWGIAADEIQAINEANISAELREKIFHINAEKLLRIG